MEGNVDKKILYINVATLKVIRGLQKRRLAHGPTWLGKYLMFLCVAVYCY